jgi:hypothetical protein
MDDNFSQFDGRTGIVRLASNCEVDRTFTASGLKDIRAEERRSAGRNLLFSGVTSGAMLHAGTITAKRVLVRVGWWHGGRFRSTELSS